MENTRRSGTCRRAGPHATSQCAVLWCFCQHKRLWYLLRKTRRCARAVPYSSLRPPFVTEEALPCAHCDILAASHRARSGKHSQVSGAALPSILPAISESRVRPGSGRKCGQLWRMVRRVFAHRHAIPAVFADTVTIWLPESGFIRILITVCIT